jgi:hypothetical protein
MNVYAIYILLYIQKANHFQDGNGELCKSFSNEITRNACLGL